MPFEWDSKKDEANRDKHGLSFDDSMTDDIRELTDEDFARAIPRRQRERIIRGQIDPEKDIVALRRFAGLTQNEFAEALGISVHTLRNWEQGRRSPEGPAWHSSALPLAS